MECGTEAIRTAWLVYVLFSLCALLVSIDLQRRIERLSWVKRRQPFARLQTTYPANMDALFASLRTGAAEGRYTVQEIADTFNAGAAVMVARTGGSQKPQDDTNQQGQRGG